MRLRTIVLATDFSPLCSERGLAYASWLARGTGARLLIVHVDRPPQTGEAGIYEGVPGGVPPAARLAQIVPAEADIAHEHRLLVGDAAGEIIRLAEQESADVIVVGTSGRRGVSRFFLGSVAEAVVRGAPCPVLTVREKAAP